jgi:hypothetical protein
MPWPPPPQPARATDRFILILNALWTWVGEKAGPSMTGPMCWEIRRRISRIRLRLDILAKRFHAGTLTPPKPRARRRKPPEPAAAAPKPKPPFVLPRHFAWLCGLVPQWAAGCGSQIKHLMNDPQMRALEAASPEAKRLIGSLLWMTGNVHPDFRGRWPARTAPSGPKPEPSRSRPARAAAAAAPAENTPAVLPPAPPTPPPAALLVTPVIDPEMWSHYSLIPASRLKSR